MKVGSARWWFENRQTGEVTVAQFPNWPLFGIGLAWVARRLADDGSSVDRGAELASTGLWLYWAVDEIVRGVNPWRRLLGSLVLGWQAIRLID